MSGIAPNGVTMSEYDPKGVGGIATASITKTAANALGYATQIEYGETVAGAALFPCSVNANAGTANTPQVQISTIALSGVWMCLGFVSPLNDAAYTNFMCNWVRVS